MNWKTRNQMQDETNDIVDSAFGIEKVRSGPTRIAHLSNFKSTI
jgi:hypothetical protein